MGFSQHRAVKVIAEYKDAWAEKLKKIKLPQNKPRQSIKEVIYRKKIWGHRKFKRVKAHSRYISLHFFNSARAQCMTWHDNATRIAFAVRMRRNNYCERP